MTERIVTAPSMVYRATPASILNHYLYDQSGISYNNSLWTYDYTSIMGNMAERQTSSASMKGR
jgi:hypothetical protein